MVNTNITELATKRVQNYSDIQAAEAANAYYRILRDRVTNFSGGSFEFIGDVGNLYKVCIVTEASKIGSKAKPRTWIMALGNGNVIVKKL